VLDPDIVIKVANVMTSEAGGPHFSFHTLDLARELNWARVEKNREGNPSLVGEMDHAAVAALQSGSVGLPECWDRSFCKHLRLLGALKEDSFVLLLHSCFATNAAINIMCLWRVNFLITLYGPCATRACAAKLSIENGPSDEMGRGEYRWFIFTI